MAERVLVVAAHPDDEVLGAGGTVARHTARGDEAAVLILGEGAVARWDDPGAAPASATAALAERARQAARLLGVADVRFGGLPDNRFDGLALLDLVKLVERAVREVEPTVVYTHHPGDLNVDHQLTFRAALTATRPVPGAPVREVLAFEVLSSTEWAFGRTGPAFTPTVFVDVAETLERKLDALECYADELRAAPHARSREAVRAAAARWGATVGRTAAEAFELIRLVR
jgi:LmbE family N-acetylglucosaminyl deacetylase